MTYGEEGGRGFRADTPLQILLDALYQMTAQEAKKTADGWQCCCPSHDDRRPSLSIAEGEDGRALVKCHAGCTADAICSEIGLRVSDLMPTSNGPPTPRANGEAQKKKSAKSSSTAREAVE